ncbi:hypothetical protein RND71_015903 [Anisodus tanguticus]|uniref:Uncharacterized protein n=1 Tax=Anisodus tanguticus TaxID=243964 RepID=A0AAE1S6S3_9SOLA|nr:hypothetical protein RND71_015903 [Anisodus tanguticus]
MAKSIMSKGKHVLYGTKTVVTCGTRIWFSFKGGAVRDKGSNPSFPKKTRLPTDQRTGGSKPPQRCSNINPKTASQSLQQHCFRNAVNVFRKEATQTQVQHLLQIVQDDMDVGIQNSPMSCKEKRKVKNEYQEIHGMSQLKRSMTQLKEKLQD